ncbi:MAG: 50S ribosomal protein L4 [Gemmatimonadaceae bacterium]
MADTTQMDAPTYTVNGTARERVSLPAALFDGTVNVPVMHQAVKAYLANQRQGNASTKTRGFVIGGNQKPWRQKGTGRARQGSIRAPHWVGGGTVFGPTPRSYAEYVPRQVRALARKSAFNARAREGAVVVVDRFDYDAPKTARVAALLARLELDDRKVLILTDGAKQNVHLSARNIPGVRVLPYADVSTYHLLWSDVVVVEASAFGHALTPIAEEPLTERPRRKKVAKAARGDEDEAPKKTAARKGGKKTSRGGARKSAAKTAAKKGATKRAAGGSKTSAKKKSSTARKKKGK